MRTKILHTSLLFLLLTACDVDDTTAIDDLRAYDPCAMYVDSPTEVHVWGDAIVIPDADPACEDEVFAMHLPMDATGKPDTSYLIVVEHGDATIEFETVDGVTMATPRCDPSVQTCPAPDHCWVSSGWDDCPLKIRCLWIPDGNGGMAKPNWCWPRD